MYEPPEDPDARAFRSDRLPFACACADGSLLTEKSTLELGMEALARMPREQALEGALMFQGLSYASLSPSTWLLR